MLKDDINKKIGLSLNPSRITTEISKESHLKQLLICQVHSLANCTTPLCFAGFREVVGDSAQKDISLPWRLVYFAIRKMKLKKKVCNQNFSLGFQDLSTGQWADNIIHKGIQKGNCPKASPGSKLLGGKNVPTDVLGGGGVGESKY